MVFLTCCINSQENQLFVSPGWKPMPDTFEFCQQYHLCPKLTILKAPSPAAHGVSHSTWALTPKQTSLNRMQFQILPRRRKRCPKLVTSEQTKCWGLSCTFSIQVQKQQLHIYIVANLWRVAQTPHLLVFSLFHCFRDTSLISSLDHYLPLLFLVSSLGTLLRASVHRKHHYSRWSREGDQQETHLTQSEMNF